ncbi:DUF5675 family protein [Thalassotalea euphylliae]|uniref:DUF5675 family protein n=1 Tax=Thalassotalea euphylliae TaxID=1655234 RepID=UPI0021637900|nr:DUF5675 family protein [Thalassotalea euphylliae]
MLGSRLPHALGVCEYGNANINQTQRNAKHSGSIIGLLYVNRNYVCDTLELPWRNNSQGISCIPTGTYGGFVREDGARGWRIQLTQTSPRVNIQIHVGNYPHEIEGCILVGERSKLRNFVGSSRVALGSLRTIYAAHLLASTYSAGGITDSVRDIPIQVNISGEVPTFTSRDDDEYLRQYLREGRNTKMLDARHIHGVLT